MARKLLAEFLGTALLVFFAVGVATFSFGKFGKEFTAGALQGVVGAKGFGTSPAAGVVATALAFGLVLLVLVYLIGHISGAHVNPAVTIGFLASRRMSMQEAVGYWIAQFAGGILGALVLWGVFKQADFYTSQTGLGADGYGKNSLVHLSAGGAFLAEVVLTFLFVLVVLGVTARTENTAVAGVAIGLALTTVHLVGIPLTGTSVNPARSLGPAIFAGGDALAQVWLFIVAPLVGGILAAGVYLGLLAQPVEPGPAPDEPAEIAAS